MYLVRTLTLPITQEIENLPDFRCAAVVLSISNTIDDGSDTLKESAPGLTYAESALEVYWGHGGVCGHQLFPGETTDYIYVKNLSDISIRCNRNNSDGVTVYASIFKTDE